MGTHRLVILQSNYIPWKGYFDLIDRADEFVFLDAQYTRRDWRNRNRIKTARGLEWLTIPVEVKGKYEQNISETRISDQFWGRRHWHSLQSNYGKAPFFRLYEAELKKLYDERYEYLSQANKAFIVMICKWLGIKTPIVESDKYPSKGTRTERLVEICRQAGATHYLTGPAARNYLDENKFGGIRVQWMSYAYPEYPQMHPPFEHGVSVLDLLFNTGPQARNYMRDNSHEEQVRGISP